MNMRTIWQTGSRGRRLMRLSFVILTFVVAFFLAAHGLSLIGASRLDADGGASIVALVSAALAMYS